MQKNLDLIHTSKIEIHTDGSCKLNDGKNEGTHALVVTVGRKVLLEYAGYNKVTTNNKEELQALILAVQIAKEFPDYKFYVKSDSQYSLNTLFGTFNGTKNKDLQQTFTAFKDVKNYNVEYIKGHDGNVLNNYADMLCELKYKTVKNER